MFSRFDRIPACDRWKDRQVSCHDIVHAMHTHRAVIKLSILYPNYALIWWHTSCQREQRQEVGREQATQDHDLACVCDLSLATSVCHQKPADQHHLLQLLRSLCQKQTNTNTSTGTQQR